MYCRLFISIIAICFSFSASADFELVSELNDSELAGVDGQDGVSFDWKIDDLSGEFGYKNDGVGEFELYWRLNIIEGGIASGETTLDTGMAVDQLNGVGPDREALLLGMPKFIEFDNMYFDLGWAYNFDQELEPEPVPGDGFRIMRGVMNGRLPMSGTIQAFSYTTPEP